MSTTANGLTYSNLTDLPNGPGQIQGLAESVDARYGASSANYAGLSAIGDPYPGMRVWLVDQKGFAVYNGTDWVEPDRTGTGTFTASAHPANGLHTYTIPYGFTRGRVPTDVVAQIVGFVTNSSQAVVKGVVGFDEDSFDLSILNTSGAAVSFTNLPVRFRVFG